MRWHRRSLLAAGGAATLLGPARAAWGSGPVRRITLLTDGGPVGRHSYCFLAASNGYYAAEGLEVDIIGGKGSAAVVKEVAAGSVTLGFADAGDLGPGAWQRRRAGQDGGRGLQQRSPCVDRLGGIRDPAPKDLVGKTASDVAGSANYLLFPAYAKFAGFDPATVEWVFADFNALPAMLVTRQVDAIGQFTIGLPLLEKRAQPQKLVPLAYRDVGLDIYSNGIIAREDMLRTDPDLIRAFVRATLPDCGTRSPIQSPRVPLFTRHYPPLRQMPPRVRCGRWRKLPRMRPRGPMALVGLIPTRCSARST